MGTTAAFVKDARGARRLSWGASLVLALGLALGSCTYAYPGAMGYPSTVVATGPAYGYRAYDGYAPYYGPRYAPPVVYGPRVSVGIGPHWGRGGWGHGGWGHGGYGGHGGFGHHGYRR